MEGDAPWNDCGRSTAGARTACFAPPVRIAFVSANRERMPDAVIPFGLLSVMAATPARHERALIDLCFETEPDAALRRELARFEPDVVAVGLRNLQNNDYSGHADNVAYYAQLIEAIRHTTDAPIVLGGAGLSVMPEALLATLRADFAIAGEGELAFPAFLAAYEPRAAVDAVPALYRREGAHVHRPRRATPFAALDALPPIDRRLADARYYERYGIDSVQTKRGCSLRCDYCTYPSIEGRASRRRSAHLVADELERIQDARPDAHVFVVDSVFNLPRAHAMEVCDAMIARGIALPWTCYVNPIAFDAELAERMVAAGCAGVEIGSDSGCDDVLVRLKKGFTVARIRAAHEAASRAGLKDCHTFVLGTAGETLDHVRRTLDFLVDLDPYAAILLPWVDDSDAIDPAQRDERRRRRDQVLELLARSAAQFPRWIIPPLGTNFHEPTFDALRARGLRGPLWQHVRRLPARRERRARGGERTLREETPR